MRDEKKHYGAVDESSVEQQFRKSSGRQLDKILVDISNLPTDRIVRFFTEFNEGTVLL